MKLWYSYPLPQHVWILQIGTTEFDRKESYTVLPFRSFVAANDYLQENAEPSEKWSVSSIEGTNEKPSFHYEGDFAGMWAEITREEVS